jgi:hypothetical protein
MPWFRGQNIAIWGILREKIPKIGNFEPELGEKENPARETMRKRTSPVLSCIHLLPFVVWTINKLTGLL